MKDLFAWQARRRHGPPSFCEPSSQASLLGCHASWIGARRGGGIDKGKQSGRMDDCCVNRKDPWLPRLARLKIHIEGIVLSIV
jgi:hypothetical protein